MTAGFYLALSSLLSPGRQRQMFSVQDIWQVDMDTGLSILGMWRWKISFTEINNQQHHHKRQAPWDYATPAATAALDVSQVLLAHPPPQAAAAAANLNHLLNDALTAALMTARPMVHLHENPTATARSGEGDANNNIEEASSLTNKNKKMNFYV